MNPVKYSIGLDIGIASVGWSVINSENGHIVDLGVPIFSARNSDDNETRRITRGSRRLTRRRRTRLKESEYFLNQHEFYRDEALNAVCPYELRVKGLTEQLTRAELYRVVQHIIKKRGISYLDEETVSDIGSGKEFTDLVNENALLQQKYTPGEIQLQRLKDTGRIRTGINQLGEYQLNVFTVHAYAKELRKILETQAEFYKEIDDDFINFYLSKEVGEQAGLIYRKRPYYHGPGNAKNPSEYGRWKNYPETGRPDDNIFEQLIGTDITGKVRASTLSVYAQKYNLLNDLNNLRLPREQERFTPEEKQDIIQHLMNPELKSFGPTALAKMFNLKADEIKGWRIDKSEKKQMHHMKAYRTWARIFQEYDIDIIDVPDTILDKIASIVTINTEPDAVINTIEYQLPDLDPRIKELVVQEFHNLKNAKDSSGTWHSFSASTLQTIIPELLHTEEEQNTVLERLNLKFNLRSKYSDLNYIPAKEVLEEIYNPTVSKSVRQAFKVLNALVKQYGKENITHVTIEMPRDKNSDEQKKKIKEIQKSNEERHKKSREYFLKKSNWDNVRFEAALSKPSFARKLYYYYEQDGICAYSGKEMTPDALESAQTEIDHIIPLSISLDDSINNKVLVLSKKNQAKGQRSPYQAFQSNNMGRSWEEYKAWVNSNPHYKKNRYKRNNLLLEEDIYNPDVQSRFVARNLNDTRYASRIVLNAVQSFFYGSETKVKVINGTYTHTLRKKWGNSLEKNRESHHHHAVDATLCAVSPFVKTTPYEYHYDEASKKSYMLDLETGEMIPYNKYKNMPLDQQKTYVPEWDDFIPQLIPTQLYPRIKFSHRVDKKANRKISDATIYSIREVTETNKKGEESTVDYIIGKTRDIYTYEGYQDYLKKQDSLLMKEIDPKTFEILEQIIAKYPDSIDIEDASGKKKKIKISPFKLYADDNDVPGVRKYSKKGNGPIVRTLKYYDKKLGSHINITKDQNNQPIEKTTNNRKVALLSLKPWRSDIYYSEKENLYKIVGIRYNNLKFIKGEYGIPSDVYQTLKEKEGVTDQDVFCFSLYKGDRIRITKGEETIEGLYHARNYSNKNYFEMKPIDKSKWDSKEVLPVFSAVSSGGQFIKGISKGMTIQKLHTNILGNVYVAPQEKEPKNIIIEE